MAGFEHEDDHDPFAENDLMESSLDDDACLILQDDSASITEDELAFEEISSDAPVSAMDMLGRLDSAAELLAEQNEPETPPPLPVPAEEGGDDIQEYMASLLQRSNGFSGQADSVEQATAKVAAAKPQPEESTPEARWEGSNERRKKAREADQGDLSGMRELANMNARSALDTHSHQVTIRGMWANLSIAATGISVSVALLFLSEGVTATFFLSIISMMVGTVWSIKFLRAGAQLKQLIAEEAALKAIAAESPLADQPVPVADPAT